MNSFYYSMCYPFKKSKTKFSEMEENEISMVLDVKIEEKNFEMLNLRSWTKCLVKIEAIKCLPCFIKMTFIKDYNKSENVDYVTIISLPGLNVQMASSRTKNYAYGLFWTSNRKACKAFFGFENKEICEKHMKWLKASIKNLELHRKEMLQLRRMSRLNNGSIDQILEPNITENNQLIYQNINNTQDIKDVKDILGPLPNIPNISGRESNWERRISGMSGIYEEIRDPLLDTLNDRRISRSSIASGIYEEMRPVSNPDLHSLVKPETTEDNNPPKSPPPLPPRSRLNTLESEIPRSLTNPESFKKVSKRLKVIEAVFGRSPSISSSKSESKKLSENKYSNFLRRNVKPKYLEFELENSKRNSFSSPDLSKLNNIYENNNSNNIDNILDSISSTSKYENTSITECNNISFQDHYADIMYKEESENLNISEQIQPSFNLSCMNSSKINLVGSNIMNQTNYESFDELSILRKKSIDNTMDNVSRSTITSSTSPAFLKSSVRLNSIEIKENRCSPVFLGNGDKIECLDIKFKFDDNFEKRESIENHHDSSGVYENVEKEETNHYVDMTKSKSKLNINSQNNSQSESTYDSPKRVLESGNNSIKMSRNSIDDKIPSYYPNEYKTNITLNNKSENLYISTPKLNKRKLCKESNLSPLTPKPIKENCYVTNKSSSTSKLHDHKTQNKNNDGNLIPVVPPNTPQPISQRIYQKYATISRASNKYIEKCAKNSPSKIENVRKFASLPRFRKIDLSPLKLKINSVLQRHNSDF